MNAKKSIARIFSILFVIMFMLAVAPLQAAQATGPRYAKPAGTGDCSTWANACTLQSALTGAVSGDEVWVAAGTYKPTTNPANRDATFQLKNGVAVYGGFAGTETARADRNPVTNVTILSGDIDNNDSQTPILTDITTVTGNTTNSVHVVTGATGATLDGFTITAGNANNGVCPGPGCGGGMYNLTSSPTLSNLNIAGNTAVLIGGGMYNGSGSNPLLTNVNFTHNSATGSGGQGGGGMANIASSPTLTNVTFSSNSTQDCGGGMYNYDYAGSAVLTNVTFGGNMAAAGGGICNGWSNPTIRNTIFWANAASSGAQIQNNYSNPSVSDSVVQGGYASGVNILTGDPKLGALGNYGGFSQTLPILAGSSAIDTGNDSFCPATDQRGISRPQGTRCDIGAFEYAGIDYVSVRYAKPAASGSGNCSTWANACTLQSALTGADFGFEIWAAAGTYKPTTDPLDRNATFQLKNGVAVYGGFAGTEAARADRNPVTNVTILSGDIDNNDSQAPIITDLTSVTGNTTNSIHVVTGTTYSTVARLDGFTITAGNANNGVCPGPGCGGGMYNLTSSPTLSNLNIAGNTAVLIGGGMYNGSGSNPMVTNVTFTHNSATGSGGQGGGGMANIASSPTLTNVTFSSNSTQDCGGGMYNYDYAGSAVLTNVTFGGNLAAAGGGICNGWTNPTIRNTIFWANAASSGAQIQNNYSNPSVSDSVVQGGYASGVNILTGDPKLGALGNYGGFSQTLPILAGSSAIDTGNDSFCPATDQRGISRPQGTRCDIGAFEYAGIDYVSVRYAKPAASGSGNCSSWANACTLQSALTGADFGFEIWAAAGTYKPTTDPLDRNATFQLKNGVAVYGGFAGTEAARADRNPVTNVTILSGDIDNNDSQTPILTDLTSVTGNTTNSIHVVTGTTYSTVATLDGFTITAGNANNGVCPGPGCGGGMYNLTSSPTLSNINIAGNTAVLIGGGMYNGSGSNPMVTNVTFTHNSATGSGGQGGGGMANISSSPTLTNVTFSSNSTQDCGGGMYNYDYAGSAVLTNVTFGGNLAAAGGGICNGWSNPTIRNTIFWGNTAPGGAQIFDQGSTPSMSDSVVQGGYAGGTNILTGDPKLGTLGNYGGFTQTIPILAGSSAIDTGNDSVCPATDQRGVPRPHGLHCDIGAYESVDTTAPTVFSSVRANANPTSAASVDFTVTFSESVTGVDKDDFSLTITGVSGANATGVSGSGSVYTVTVNTGSGNGSLRLEVPLSGVSITDLSGNPLASLPYTGGQTYTIIKTYSIYLPLVIR